MPPTILHAPRQEHAYVPACGAYSMENFPKVAEPGDIVNCPDCRTVLNHMRANFTREGYRYMPAMGAAKVGK